MNSLGPCPDCGEALGTDQRYCANCGHRVEAPLAPTYIPVAPVEPVAARSGGWPFPIPVSMASTFVALALGFGVVLGTAVSPNLSELVAGGKLTEALVAEAPPASEPAPSKKPAKGGGKAEGDAIGAGRDLGSSGTGFFGSSGSTPSYGGVNTGGGSKKKKKKPKKPKPTFLSGTVVRKNPVAGSYSISSGGGLSAIHAKVAAGLPAPGTKVKVPIRRLANRTYAEDGKRQKKGQATQATFSGVVTDSRNSVVATTPDAYTVSGLGASVLVHAEDPAMTASPPLVGQLVTTTVEIRNAAGTPVPIVPPPSFTCPSPPPPAGPFPAPPIVPEKELFQKFPLAPPAATVTTTDIATVVQATCEGPPKEALLSSDDTREGGADLLLSAPGIDLGRLAAGQPILASVTIVPDPLGPPGAMKLDAVTGTASDQGIKGADDKASGQGNLARVARASERRIARAAERPRR